MKLLVDIGLQFYRSAHARSAVGYLAANIIAAFIPFCLLPIMTRLMTPEAYGHYSMFMLAVSVAMPLVSLSLVSVVGREYTLRDAAGFSRIFSTSFGLSFIAFFIAIIACLLLRAPLERAIHIPIGALLLALVYAMAQGILLIMQNIRVMQKNPRSYMFWRIGFVLAGSLAGYAAVASHDGDWKSLTVSQSTVGIITILIALFVSLKNKWLIPSFNRSDARLALTYSIPLIIHAMTAGIIVQNADRFFVSQFMGLAEVGSYNVAQQVSLAMYVIVSSLNQAWSPWYYEQMKTGDHNAHRRIVRFTYLGFAGLAVLGLVVAAVLWLAYPYIVGQAFMAGRGIFPLLILGFVLNGMYVLVGSGMFYTGHTFQLMLCNIGSAIVNISLNLWLVPRYGMYGAASATVLSTLAMLLFVWGATARLHRLPWLLRIPSIPENNG